MKDVKILISSILIVISFFVGYFLEKNNLDKTDKDNKNYVNLEILKTKIKISKNPNTIITLNWKILKNNEIKLSK